MVIRDASDVTKQLKARLTYMALTGTGGQRAVDSMVPKSNETYTLFRWGAKECTICVGSTFKVETGTGSTMTFRA